ncbi:MAG: hypothetical protein Q8P67_02795, partial [archaeon]|nr:hypothetical protein [archaeon]
NININIEKEKRKKERSNKKESSDFVGLFFKTDQQHSLSFFVFVFQFVCNTKKKRELLGQG